MATFRKTWGYGGRKVEIYVLYGTGLCPPSFLGILSTNSAGPGKRSQNSSKLEETGQGLVERLWTLDMDRPKVVSAKERALNYPIPSVSLGWYLRLNNSCLARAQLRPFYLFVYLLIYF